jgi:hypothetical protein
LWWLERYPALREHLEVRYRRVSETEAYLIFDVRHRKGRISGSSPWGGPG